jgi:chromosome partitioning protein
MSDKIGSIWTFGNTKGGVGKTSTCTNTATALAQLGHSVCIINADPNNNTAGAGIWGEVRTESIANGYELTPIDVKSIRGDIFDTVQLYSKKYDFVLVDTGGLDSTEFSAAAATSHLIIIPVECDVLDAKNERMGFSAQPIKAMNEQIKRITAANRNVKCVALLNKVPTVPNSPRRKETKIYLNTLSHLKPLKNTISYYENIYNEAASYGAGVVETKHTRAASQYQLVVKELITLDSGE